MLAVPRREATTGIEEETKDEVTDVRMAEANALSKRQNRDEK